MEDIAIFGAGGFGREVKMLIDQINLINPTFNFLGYYDDGVKNDHLINGFPILGGIKELNNSKNQSLNIVFAIGNPKIKKELRKNITNKEINYPVLINPNVLIGFDHVNIGEGSIICAGTIITININIGKHVILNLGCTVGHDTNIGDYSSFMPAVNISGEVNIKNSVYVGTGAKLINQLEIGENATIGAGSVIIKDVPDNAVVVGNPGKIIKYNDSF